MRQVSAVCVLWFVSQVQYIFSLSLSYKYLQKELITSSILCLWKSNDSLLFNRIFTINWTHTAIFDKLSPGKQTHFFFFWFSLCLIFCCMNNEKSDDELFESNADLNCFVGVKIVILGNGLRWTHSNSYKRNATKSNFRLYWNMNMHRNMSDLIRNVFWRTFFLEKKNGFWFQSLEMKFEAYKKWSSLDSHSEFEDDRNFEAQKWFEKWQIDELLSLFSLK